MRKIVEQTVQLLWELNIKGRDAFILNAVFNNLGQLLEQMGSKQDDNSGNIPANNGGDRASLDQHGS